MSDALVFDSCFGRSQIHLFLKKSGCVAPRTDLSFKVSTWSNRSGDASPSATQHSLIGNERSGGSSFWLDQNGEGGIRTHGAREDTLVFKTRAINHSTTSPEGVRCPAGHPTTVSGRAPSSVFRLGQRQQTLIGITSGRACFRQLTLVVTLQCFEEITADATLHHGRLQLLVGGCIDWLKGQAGEGGIGIETGQKSC